MKLIHFTNSWYKPEIKGEYLQNYLDESCYKTNRRYFGNDLFKRFVLIAVEDTWYGKKWYING